MVVVHDSESIREAFETIAELFSSSFPATLRLGWNYNCEVCLSNIDYIRSTKCFVSKNSSSWK